MCRSIRSFKAASGVSSVRNEYDDEFRRLLVSWRCLRNVRGCWWDELPCLCFFRVKLVYGK